MCACLAIAPPAFTGGESRSDISDRRESKYGNGKGSLRLTSQGGGIVPSMSVPLNRVPSVESRKDCEVNA